MQNRTPTDPGIRPDPPSPEGEQIINFDSRKQLLIDVALLLLALGVMLVAMQQPGDIITRPLFFIEWNPSQPMHLSSLSPTTNIGKVNSSIIDPLSAEAFFGGTESTIEAARRGEHPVYTGNAKHCSLSEQEQRVTPPPPLMADLEGDGRYELVVVTSEPRIKTYKFYSNLELLIANRFIEATRASLLASGQKIIASQPVRSPGSLLYDRDAELVRFPFTKSYFAKRRQQTSVNGDGAEFEKERMQGKVDRGNEFLKSLPSPLLELADGRYSTMLWTPFLFPKHATRGSQQEGGKDSKTHQQKQLRRQSSFDPSERQTESGQLVLVSTTPLLTQLKFNSENSKRSDCVNRYLKQVVAITSGYLTTLPLVQEDISDELEDRVSRRQVVFAVTKDWTVLCFDHRMRLIWAHRVTKLGSPANEWSNLEDATIYVVPGSAVDTSVDPRNEFVSGYVVIAGRQSDKRLITSSEDKVASWEMPEEPETLLSDSTDFRTTNHFSYIALGLESGHELWRHGSQSFQSGSDPAKVLRPGRDIHKHEQSWLPFRHQVTEEILPMIWTSPLHTTLKGVSLVKKREGFNPSRIVTKSRTQAERWSDGLMGVGLKGGSPTHDTRAMSIRTGYGSYGDSGLEGTGNSDFPPNSLISLNREGIEILDPKTGETMVRLRLQPGILHVDLDGDGVIDHVSVSPLAAPRLTSDPSQSYKAGLNSDGSNCEIVVTSGIGESDFILRIDPCAKLDEMLVGTSSVTSLVHEPEDTKVNRVEFAPPLAKPLPRYFGERSRYEIILLASNGAIMSLDHQGELLWVTSSRFASWNSDTSKSTTFEPTLKFVALTGKTQSIGQFDPYLRSLLMHSAEHVDRNPNAESEVILVAVGEKGFALIDPSDGTLRAEVPFSGTAYGSVSVGRLDYDSLNSIVITTNHGYLGFRVERASSTGVFTVVLTALFVFLLICFTVKHSTVLKSDNSRAYYKRFQGVYNSSPGGSGSQISPVSQMSPVSTMSPVTPLTPAFSDSQALTMPSVASNTWSRLRWSKRNIVVDSSTASYPQT